MGILKAAKSMRIQHNVSFRVLDASTGKLVKEYTGHNQATNSLLMGIAHYLKGDGILNQGTSMLSAFIPKYISLGTMGLDNQEEDSNGLPTGVRDDYASQKPGYGADGYDENKNNGRSYLGLGPVFNKEDATKNCELVSSTFPRAPITYRQIVPEQSAELEETVDVIFSAMISTGALAQFRDDDKDYIFITEAGLWSQKTPNNKNPNGLLAAYRILPSDEDDRSDKEAIRKNILKVNKNQVVQVIWKIQIGAGESFSNQNCSCNCDCICQDRNNPNPDCPCHGKKDDESVTTLKLDKNSVNIDVERQFELTATVNPQQAVEWSVDKAGIVTYEPVQGKVNTILVTSIADGDVVIKAVATDGSGAQDTCNVTVNVNVPIGDLESYTLFSTANLIIGARTHIYGENIGIGSTITWEASPYPSKPGYIEGYSDNSALYIWGDNTGAGAGTDVITSAGGNIFEIAVYMPEGSTVSISNKPESTEVFKKGRYILPDNIQRPAIQELDPEKYVCSNNDINIGASCTAYMYPDHTEIHKPDATVTRVYPVITAGVSGYGNISFDSNKDNHAILHVMPGSYAVKSVSQTGNFAQFRFKDSTASHPTVFFVDGNINLSNDTYISNDGAPRSCMVYCTGDMYAGATNEMRLYLVAPHGEVHISNGNENKEITLYGNIYAERIVLENDIDFGIKEV